MHHNLFTYSHTEPIDRTPRTMICYSCGKSCHVSRECRNNKCYDINKDGHFANECPTKKDNKDKSSGAKWSTSNGRDGDIIR